MLLEVESPQFKQVLAAFVAADRELQDDLVKAGDASALASWSAGLASRSSGPQDYKTIVAGNSVSTGAAEIVLAAGASTAPLSGGMVPLEHWQAVEFGARTRRAVVNTHSRKGKPYQVTKMLNRGLPNRQRFGRIGFKTASESITEIFRVYIDTIVDTYQKALDHHD